MHQKYFLLVPMIDVKNCPHTKFEHFSGIFERFMPVFGDFGLNQAKIGTFFPKVKNWKKIACLKKSTFWTLRPVFFE